jgi:hypothetical protein
LDFVNPEAFGAEADQTQSAAKKNQSAENGSATRRGRLVRDVKGILRHLTHYTPTQ